MLMNKPETERVRTLLLTEMITRLAKNILRFKLRNTEAETVFAYKAQIVDFFNLLLGNSRVSTQFWENEIGLMLILRYGRYSNFLDAEERLASFNLRAKINKLLLFHNLQEKTGLCFCAVDPEVLETQAYPFSNSDLLGMEPKVKLHIREPLPTNNWPSPFEEIKKEMEERKVDHLAQYGKELQYIENKYGMGSEQYVVASLKLAQFFFVHGDIENTKQLCHKGTQILENLQHCSVDIAIGVYYILGMITKKLNNFSEALKHFESAKDSLERCYGGHLQFGGGAHPFLVFVWKGMSECLSNLGNMKEAKILEEYSEHLTNSYPKNFFSNLPKNPEECLLFENPSGVSFRVAAPKEKPSLKNSTNGCYIWGSNSSGIKITDLFHTSKN